MAKQKVTTKKKASKKKVTRKKAKAKPASSEDLALQRVNIHNCTNNAANATVSGAGNKVRVVIPPLGHCVVKLPHAKSYNLICWGKDPKKKEKGKVQPSGSGIYTGRKVHATHPH